MVLGFQSLLPSRNVAASSLAQSIQNGALRAGCFFYAFEASQDLKDGRKRIYGELLGRKVQVVSRSHSFCRMN